MSDPLRPYQPSDTAPFDLARVGHLFRRVGFGASLEIRRRAMREGVDRAIDMARVDRRGEDVEPMSEIVIGLRDMKRLRSFRMWRALAAKDRLNERMSLFWHDHFATSNRKLADPAAMARQFDVFDRLGTGTFDSLVDAICHGAAMLRWLDNDTNVKQHPNENFARELFELFTLGRGNYSERDVKEAARAFTGWHVRHGQFWFKSRAHDRGEKEVLGQRGRFDGTDIVRIALEHPASARFVARKLLQHFVHPSPTESEIDAVAAVYTARERHVGETVDVILRSELFFSERAMRSRIKSPIDYVVGLVRSIGATASPERLARAAASMGQSIGEPPNVAGWPGERAWLNSATWLLRSNFAAELERRYRLEPSIDGVVDSVDTALDALVDGEISAASREALDTFVAREEARGEVRVSTIVHAVQNLPEAQLL